MRKLLLSLVGLALIASPAFAGKYNKVINVGDRAPSFSGLPGVSGDKDVSVSLDDFKAPVTVVVFLGNHCPVVVAYEDRIIDFVNDYKAKGVKVVGVCVEDREVDKLPGIKNHIAEKKIPYVYGYDASQDIGRAYGATNTPQFVVLDKDRVIRYTGAMDDNMKEDAVQKTYLRDAVDALLKGETPEVTETRAVGCGIRYKRS
jgi:thiol-disulfide isomerase/thioredoxin